MTCDVVVSVWHESGFVLLLFHSASKRSARKSSMEDTKYCGADSLNDAMNRLFTARYARHALLRSGTRALSVRTHLSAAPVSHVKFEAIRFFSDATSKPEEQHETEEQTETPAEHDGTTVEDAEAPAPEVSSTIVDELEAQVKNLKNQLLLSLADQENTRRIAKKDVESARKFAIKSFAKSLLETSDNLERALHAVPDELLKDGDGSDHGSVDVRRVLVTLFEGIKMTEDGLNKALESNGLERFGEVGEIFDPNRHDALFEYPDATKTPGTVGQVINTGFLLNKRVLRPAEVGVIKE